MNDGVSDDNLWPSNVQHALDYRLTPLHQAVECDDAEELTRLLDAGHDPDEFDPHSGWTPLLRAIDGESDSAVQTGTPLQAACTAVLLAYGAAPEQPSRDGLLPMHLALQTHHVMAVRLLERHIDLRRTPRVD